MEAKVPILDNTFQTISYVAYLMLTWLTKVSLNMTKYGHMLESWIQDTDLL